MKNAVLFLTIVILALTVPAQAQSLDDILKDHFAAIGQDNLLKVNAQKISGKMIQGGIEIPFIQMSKRPEKVRVEGTFQGLTFIQTYDGTEGWSLNPFAGVSDPQPMSEDDLKGMHYQADMDGMLWKWNEKGYTVTFDGKEDMEGTFCYKIKLVTKDEDTFTFWIDSDSYMMLRSNSKLKKMGAEIESDTYYSNYMMNEGIAVPGKIETKMKGQTMGSLVVEKIELNPELSDTLFGKPGV
jgi:outer membrane lipoprotein-sorting protein